MVIVIDQPRSLLTFGMFRSRSDLESALLLRVFSCYLVVPVFDAWDLNPRTHTKSHYLDRTFPTYKYTKQMKAHD